MTPEQFAAKMRYISQLGVWEDPLGDSERTRKRLIEAMADALEDLGYKEGVRYFRQTEEGE